MGRKKRRLRQQKTIRPPSPWEKTKARKLADRYELPVAVTLGIIRGEIELSDALEEKAAKRRYQELISQGIHPNIAGQVARGRLTLEEGQIRSDLLKLQKRSFYYSRLNEYQRGERVALYLFEHGILKGIVVDKAPYDLDVVPDNSDVPVLVKKHDVKLHGDPEVLDRVVSFLKVDEGIAREHLSSTVDLEERFRPTHEDALIWVSVGAPLRFSFRDGEVIEGRVKACGVYEIEVQVNEELSVYIMTHALHKGFPPVFING